MQKKNSSDSDDVALVLKVLHKSFGVDSAILMSEAGKACAHAIPTGIAAFDFGLLGIGGVPAGQFIQIFGKDGVGKTSLLLAIIVGMQRKRYTVLAIDQKAAIASDVARARRIGVNPEKVIMLPTATSEESVTQMRVVIDKLKSSGVKLALLWDDMGLSPTEPKKKKKKDGSKVDDLKRNDPAVAAKAREMWNFCRALSGVCYRSDIPMVVVNQLTALIKTGWGSKFGPKDTTSGGGGVKYATRIHVRLDQGKQIKQGSDVIGHEVLANTLDKNSFFRPLRTKLYFTYRDGFSDRESTLLNALDVGLIKHKAKIGYTCDGLAGVRASLGDFSTVDVMHMEDKLWPWNKDPQGFDFSKAEILKPVYARSGSDDAEDENDDSLFDDGDEELIKEFLDDEND